jgi:hypothetical protein
MTVSALAKPVRAITELTPTELFGRAVKRAYEIRDSAKERAETECAERCKEAYEMYFVVPSVPANGDTPAAEAPGA